MFMIRKTKSHILVNFCYVFTSWPTILRARWQLHEIVSYYSWFITPRNSMCSVNWFKTEATSARVTKLFPVRSRLMFREGHACVKTRTVHMHIPFWNSDVFNSPLDRKKIKLSGGLNAVHKQDFKNEHWIPSPQPTIHQAISFILW
jgi:hypothetical protein